MMCDCRENGVKYLLYFLLIMIILGLIGNLISFKVFSSDALRKSPISFFYRAISVFDFMMMIDAIVYFINQKFDYDLSLVNDFFCKFRLYYSYSNGAISPWLMVVVSLDRFIMIRFPKRFPILFNIKCKLAIVCIVAMYNYAFYSFMLWDATLITVNNTGEIELSCERINDFVILQWMDFFNSTLVPFVAMIILSIILVYFVRMSRSRVHGPDSTNNNITTNHNTNNSSSNTSSRLKRDNRLTITVISLNLVFFILNLPIVIFQIVYVYMESSYLFAYVAHILYYTYFAIGFYIQLIVNRDFRNEFFRWLRLLTRRGVPFAVSYKSG